MVDATAPLAVGGSRLRRVDKGPALAVTAVASNESTTPPPPPAAPAMPSLPPLIAYPLPVVPSAVQKGMTLAKATATKDVAAQQAAVAMPAFPSASNTRADVLNLYIYILPPPCKLRQLLELKQCLTSRDHNLEYPQLFFLPGLALLLSVRGLTATV